jgi:ABC-type taurine transport system ATPase subunit
MLEDVSLNVAPEESVAILGRRWEGKTTLLNVAAGMQLADRGEVLFQGVDFANLSRLKRARLPGHDIVWLDRTEPVLGFTMLNQLGLPLMTTRWRGANRAQVRCMAADALERVGAGDLAHKRPQDLQDWERVLIGLATAVIARPKLLVIDDLLDALDNNHTFQAGALLKTLAHEYGFGALFSVSQIDSAIMADRILTLEDRTLRLIADANSAAFR